MLVYQQSPTYEVSFSAVGDAINICMNRYDMIIIWKAIGEQIIIVHVLSTATRSGTLDYDDFFVLEPALINVLLYLYR